MMRNLFFNQLRKPVNLHNLNKVNQVRLLSNESRSLIDKAVKAHPIVLFMKGTPTTPMCGFSKAVVQILDLQGADPEKIRAYNCLEDDELRSGIKEYSDWPTIPQLYVDGEFIGGCDILLSGHQSGELSALLKSKGLLAPVENTK